MEITAHVQRLKLLLGPAILMVLGSCLGSGATRDEAGLSEGRWYPIHFGGDSVGEAKIELTAIELAANDQVTKAVLTEKINFRGDQYRFEFTLVENVNKIEVLRYDPEDDIYYRSDSFRLQMSGGALTYIYFEDDGETVRRKRVIKDESRVKEAQKLLDKVQNFMVSQYGGTIYDEPVSHYHEYDKYRSLGYELLNYDRL